METKQDTKVIYGLQPNEQIEHEGDLVIEGDVGADSVIKLKDGVLTITGDVKQGAQITLSISEALKNSVQANISTGKISINGFSMNGQGHFFNGSANCLIGLNNHWIGEVCLKSFNYNNRVDIETPYQVHMVGPDCYEITPIPTNSPYYFFVASRQMYKQITAVLNDSDKVFAKIFEKPYIGKKIRVQGEKVYVDKQIPSDETSKVIKPSKLVIKGNIEDLVKLNYACDIEFNGFVGAHCKISSTIGGFTAKDVKEGTLIMVEMGVEVGNVGDDVEIKSGKSVTCKDVGKYSTIISEDSSVKAGNIGTNVTIKANKSISANNVGSKCKFTSEDSGIGIKEAIGDEVNLKAYKEVSCGTVGNKSTIISEDSSVKTGNIGTNVTIKAYKSISANNVGSESRLHSEDSEIKIQGDIGGSVYIGAYNNIEVKGYCPNDTKLNSENGRVKKNPNAIKPSEGLHTLGHFAVAKPVNQIEIYVDIPKAYICPITKNIMNTPVFCMVDGLHYEETAIVDWLTEHRASPKTQDVMQENQNVKDVLKIDNLVKGLIDEFKSKHQEAQKIQPK